MAATSRRAPPALQGNRMLLLVLFSSTFTLCASQDVCAVPSLDRNFLTVPGQLGVSYINTTPQSTCSGRVVGYWFCYQSTGDTTGDDVQIATALVLQEMGQSFRIIENFEVEAKPREDNCSAEVRCCVVRTLNDPFEVDLQLYGLVIPGRLHPVMIQTRHSSGHGYLFNSILYDPENNNNMVMKQTLGIASAPTPQPVKMFQFLIDNSTSSTPPTSTDDVVLTTPTADPTSVNTLPTPPPDNDSGFGSGLTPGVQESTLAPGSVTVTPTPTTIPGSPLNTAAIIGPVIAAPFLVIFTIVITVQAVVLIKCANSKKAAGRLCETPRELYEAPEGLYETLGELDETPESIGMKENEAYRMNNQAQHIATVANEAYGCVGGIPVIENVAYTPAAVNIPTVQKEAYGSPPDLPEKVQKRGEESKTGAYQTLKLETMDSCSTYSKIHKQQTPTVERGNHVYAVIDSTGV